MKPESSSSALHPRNQHRTGYDFGVLVQAHPTLSQHVRPNAYGDDSIDFANPQAVKALNQALLKQYYGVAVWDIPKSYLCPPIPGRADYVHYLADLLAESGMTQPVRMLDIGDIWGQSKMWGYLGSE